MKTWVRNKLVQYGPPIRQFLTDHPEAQAMTRRELGDMLSSILDVSAGTIANIWTAGEGHYWVTERQPNGSDRFTRPYTKESEPQKQPITAATIVPEEIPPGKKCDPGADLVQQLAHYLDNRNTLIADLTAQLAAAQDELNKTRTEYEEFKKKFGSSGDMRRYEVAEVSPHYIRGRDTKDALSIKFVIPNRDELEDVSNQLLEIQHSNPVTLIIPVR